MKNPEKNKEKKKKPPHLGCFWKQIFPHGGVGVRGKGGSPKIILPLKSKNDPPPLTKIIVKKVAEKS